MISKPSYEELEQRVRELEKDTSKLKLTSTIQAQNEDRFRIFLNNLGDIAYETDSSGNVTYANKITEVITGVPLNNIIGYSFLPLITKESQQTAIDMYQETLNGKRPEFELTFTNGRICHFKNEPLKNQRGKIIGVFGIARDITKSKKVEKTLKESEARYRALFENMIDGMAVYDAKNDGEDFIFVDLNKAGETISRTTKSDIVGKSVLELFPGIKNLGLFDVFQDVWRSGQPAWHPTRLYKDNRISHWVENAVYKLPTGEIVAVYSDETKRKKAEESLKQAHDELEKRVRERTAELEKINVQLKQEIETRKQTEKWLKSIFDSTLNVSFIITDLNGAEARIIEFSRGAEHIFDYSREEVIGKPVAMLHLPEDVARFSEAIEAMRRNKKGFIGESTLVRKSGEKFKALFNTAPLFDAKGQMVATLGVSIDISCWEKTAKKLRQSEDRYRAVVESQTEMICRFLPDGTFTFVNDAFCRYFDNDREKLIDHKYIPSMLENDQKKMFKNIASLNPNAPVITHDYRVLTKDGNINWNRWTNRAIFDDQNNLVEYQAVGRDITERIRAEEMLRKNEAELEIRSRHLEEVNSALKILLKQREEDKKELQEHVVANLKELVFPYLKKLSGAKFDDRYKAYINIIESNLNDIISPFVGGLASKFLKLTPTEIQVANLIKYGKTTKDIAEMLNLSVETIKFHRKNIREKIGIKNKKANLRTYLLSIQ